MAFKRSRLNPFQNYRSITSFSVDWPRTIRLVYASVSILSVCAIMLQVIVIQTRWNKNDWQKSFISKNLVVRHVTRPCPCMTTSIIIKITRVISMWTPHWITVSYHGVEGPMTTGYYCAVFPFCGGGKKKRWQKNKGVLRLGYHRYPSKKNLKNNIFASVQRVVCCSHQSDRLGYVSRTNQSVGFVLRFESCSNFNEVMGDSERAVRNMESSFRWEMLAFLCF